MMAYKKTCGEPHTLLLRLFFNIFLFDRFYSICFHLLLSLCCRTSRYGHLSKTDILLCPFGSRFTLEERLVRENFVILCFTVAMLTE